LLLDGGPREVGTVAWVQLRIFTEPQQGASYEQLLAVAQTAEELGFDAFFRSDHFVKMGDVSGLPGPSDAWVVLAGLARETSRIRLGTLMTSATFRLPGPLAISVANVDAMSGGRVELGLGAGWFDDEHHAYGIPFPSVGERFERFEEQLAIISGLWATPTGTTFSFEGTHYRLSDSPALPKPKQTPPPIIIGGAGKVRTPRLAARYAAEFNLSFPAPGDVTPALDRVRSACHAVDRDPATLVFSAAQVVCVGADEAEVVRRAAAIGRDPDELRTNGVAGTLEEAAQKLATLADQGVTRVYLQFLDLDDLDHLRLLATLL
jgi:F420-dependent oxidoreductase-like protein